jgi:6-pyruvoyltetrahydropterin/6-carboxytetrahydropterin synthase
MYELRVKDHFDAAHYLADYNGPCRNIHGHRWEVEVCIKGADLDRCNMLIDFKEIKSRLKPLINILDHNGFLNDNLNTPNPTAELIAKWFFDHLSLEGLYSVIIWESPECSITWRKDDC